MAISWLELSTGRFMTQNIDEKQLSSAVHQIMPSELLIPEKLYAMAQWAEFFDEIHDILTILPDTVFDSQNATQKLHKLYGVSTLESYGQFSQAEISAAGTLIDYAEKTQKGTLPYIAPIQQETTSSQMLIDGATRRNLELTRNMNGERKGSLLETIDRTLTGAGARALQQRLSTPSSDVGQIQKWHAQLATMITKQSTRASLTKALKEMPDVERALSRLSLGRGGPRDLSAIARALDGFEDIHTVMHGCGLEEHGRALFSDALTTLASIGEQADFHDRLRAALEDDLPFHARDGGFIKEGFSPQLDKFRALKNESRKEILALQTKYIEKSGVSTLKIKFNNVLGYFIEVGVKHGDALMIKSDKNTSEQNDNPFIHRQTLANAVRFTTAELADLETNILKAADKSIAIELELFEQMRAEAVRLAPIISQKARIVAELDICAGFADLALDMNYCRPVINNSLDFDIYQGRHPVVERSMRAQKGKQDSQSFIANDCNLSPGEALWLVTGPNMAGKSTFLRQNALIAIMAQIGSYVPAERATIGVIDRVFSRVGASDDLARGRSTFMVEMVETAAILNQSTDRSLVILDEIGRGTATFDGLSIAWGTLEYLHDMCRSRGLFATHYHELTTLEGKLKNLSCHRMHVKEWKGDIIFMHRVVKGSADQSYGIHVAKLAGLPAPVIKRAKDILSMLHESEQSGQLAKLADSLPLFQIAQEKHAAEPTKEMPQYDENATAIKQALEGMHPDELSPKDALDALYHLKSLLKN
jgi:DNA mismatch repair protein MutS